MAGTRQYATNADVPFELFDRGSNTTLADVITTANAGGAMVTTYDANAINLLGGTTINSFSGAAGNTSVVSGIVAFPNNSTGTGNNDYHIHVIRNHNFIIENGGVFRHLGLSATAAAGIHVVWINCNFTLRDSNLGTSGNHQWVFQNGGAGLGNNNGGFQLGRPADITGQNLSTTRTHDFFGCTFVDLSNEITGGAGNPTTTTNQGQVRMSVGEMHESLFIQSTIQETSKRYWIFTQPGCLLRNNTISAPGAVSNNDGPNRIWLTGPVQLEATDTRGMQVAVADDAQVKAFGIQGLPGTGIAAFNTGNSFGGQVQNEGYSYLKSVNPVITIGTGDAQSTLAQALSYSGGNLNLKRYIELVQYGPTFREVAGGAFAEGISFSNDFGWSWQTGDTLDRYPDADNTLLTGQEYLTNSAGIIAGANLYIPDTGRTGTIDATGEASGLQIPVAVYARQGTTGNVSNSIAVNDSVIRYRGFFQDVEFTGTDERGTYADGEVTLTVNKGFLDTRATSTNSGTAVGAGADFVTPIDTSLSTAARGRTLANLDDYFDDATNGILIGTNAISMQDVSDVLKWQHYRRNTDSYRTVNNGVVTTDFNISVNATATDAVSIATDTIVLRTAGFNSGTGTGAGTTGPVTSLVTTGNIDLDSTTLVDTNISAAEISGISTTGTAIRGGSVTGILTGLNGQSIIVDGDPDLSGITIPAGETLTVSGTFTAGRSPTAAGITVLSTIAVNGLINPGGTDALRGYLTAWDVGTNNTLTRIPLNRIVDQANAQATTDTADTFAGRVSTAATSINITGINDTSTTRVVLTHPNFRTQVMEISGGGTLQFVPASISVPAESLIPNGVSIAVADADAAITGVGTTPRLTLTVTSPFANPPGPTEVNALLHRDIKTKLQYQRLIAILADGADGIADDETVLNSPSNASPAGLNGNLFNLVPNGTTIQGLGFINNLDPAERSLSTADLAAGNVVAGVLVFPETMFDLALTINELTDVVSSETYINDVTTPGVNAIRNFLQLTDN